MGHYSKPPKGKKAHVHGRNGLVREPKDVRDEMGCDGMGWEGMGEGNRRAGRAGGRDDG